MDTFIRIHKEFRKNLQQNTSVNFPEIKFKRFDLGSPF